MINRPIFKAKIWADSHSIRQIFNAEKPNLAIFDTKAPFKISFSEKIFSVVNYEQVLRGSV